MNLENSDRNAPKESHDMSGKKPTGRRQFLKAVCLSGGVTVATLALGGKTASSASDLVSEEVTKPDTLILKGEMKACKCITVDTPMAFMDILTLSVRSRRGEPCLYVRFCFTSRDVEKVHFEVRALASSGESIAGMVQIEDLGPEETRPEHYFGYKVNNSWTRDRSLRFPLPKSAWSASEFEIKIAELADAEV